MKPDLSIIILSYNTLSTTQNCLKSLLRNLKDEMKLTVEILIVDNASVDGSSEMIKNFVKKNEAEHIQFITLFNNKNIGFGAGNNQALKKAKGKLILFLNSDTILENINFGVLINYFEEHPDVGVLTVKVVLSTGKIDPASHRGFPTIWNSFCYFLKLEKLFGKIPLIGKIFGGYHLTYLDINEAHEIDSPTGAFYLVKKEVIEKVGGFDEKRFFMYGEDLDLSYRIKEAGYKLIYYPHFVVQHLKYQSGLKKANQLTQVNTKNYFYDAMKVFYQKHYAKKHSTIVNNAVYYFIDLKKKIS